MEKFPSLRRIPTRIQLCIYFFIAIGAIYALFNFYLESHNTIFLDRPISPSDLSNYVLASEKTVPSSGNDFKHAAEITQNSITKNKVADVVPSADESAPITNLNQARLSEPPRGVETKYVYLTTTTKTNSIAITTSSTTPSESCHSSKPKLILLWTSFFEYWDYMPESNFKHCQGCGNCKVTTDRKLLDQSDAVIFHARDMSASDLPLVRHPHQRWVFYCLESPPYSDFQGLQYMNGMFNWTMTYRRDSDIFAPYGMISKKYPTRKIDPMQLQLSFFNKTKSVVWMCSHCPTKGNRDQFIKELSKYIDVDIYGSCGDFVCPRAGTKKCFKQFAQKYKFFLAFENTICDDYLTEKFYRTLGYDIIPVVFGGTKYEEYGPPSSYIDALSFKSPKHLAFFLTGVGMDFKLYSNYFKWRKDYTVTLDNRKECDLCTLLHRKDLPPSTYPSIRNWWVEGSHCKVWKSKK